MTNQDNDPKMITAYLLGELSELEQEQLEIRYFADDALFAQLLAIEDDLIDRYARRQISGDERLRMERYFMKSPARRKRVQVAEALLRQVGSLAADVRRERLSWWRELRTLWRSRGPN